MESEKYVDESWKESAQRQKEKLINLGEKSDQSKLHIKGSFKKEEDASAASSQNKEPQQPANDNTYAEDRGVDEIFGNHISSLGYQAMIFLGQIPHPVTHLKEKNLDQAKFMIDTLGMIREKTKGNLTREEGNLLNGTIYELQMRYVEATQQETPSL